TIGDNCIITPGVVHYDVPPQTLGVGLPEDVRAPLEGKINLAAADAKRKVVKTGWDLHDWRQFMPASIILAKNFLLELQKLPMNQTLRQYLLRLAGIKIGRNVQIEDNVVFDAWFPEKITIEDGATLKRHSVIACHEGIPPAEEGEKGQFRVGEVKIGKNALIESGTGILPGVEIGDNAEVLPYTFIATDVKEGIQVVGIPSRKVGETFDIQNFMMQQFGYSATIWDEIREDHRREEMLEEELKKAEEMAQTPEKIEEEIISDVPEVIETAKPEPIAMKEMQGIEVKTVEFDVVELGEDNKELKTKRVEFKIE
ncbi:MAG: acyltransferase, partial [Promethearchaeota archaeon]